MRHRPTLGALILLLNACLGTKPIKELIDDPLRFEGTTVRIAGGVTEAVGALGYGVYEVDDGTGSLVVVSQLAGAIPAVGAKVGVEGRFQSTYPMGTANIAVLVAIRRLSR